MDYEKLGAFYLGKRFDSSKRQLEEELHMYDARDLTTHAICVGMTGSGKTGLCVDLLEEAALDGIPALIIDPKGDMTNLLLHFPELRPEDFQPWLNPDDARRKGFSVEAYAAQQAELWRNGLAQWGQSSDRVARLTEAVDRVIYTPGSEAGRPVSILQSFRAPALSWDEEAELLRERIQGLVSGLLALVGIDADPVRSREHILLASILEHYWRRGEDVDIARLILAIQTPPISKLGVFDIESFFSSKDRFGLAMELNNILASPSFQSWLTGSPMDIPRFLAAPSGKPRHSIFYIAHLSDAERMFFVSMLLNQVIGWMRTQAGTTSLRAIVYMDEIFGFLPPVANPPSKKPFMTLLKQARAFGVGAVLATQNPIDLDYKALTNTGTWLIGRLQTEQDVARVLDGLESASGQGSPSKSELRSLITGLGKRVFLAHNVHERRPVTFQTRWAMNYLRGPLTRTQIKRLQPSSGAATAAPAPASPRLTSPGSAAETRPVLDPSIPQLFLEPRLSRAQAEAELALPSGAGPVDGHLQYEPMVLARGSVHFVSSRLGIEESKNFSLMLEPPTRVDNIDWEEGLELSLASHEIEEAPAPLSRFGAVPGVINSPRDLKLFEKELSDHLYRTEKLPIYYNPILKVYSRPGESDREFRLRLDQLAREERDEAVDELNERYEKKIDRVGDRLDRAELALARKQEDAGSRKREAWLSVGESVLGMLLGRRSTRIASSSMRKYRMSSNAKLAAREVEEKVENLEEEIEDLKAELQREAEKISQRWEEVVSEIEEKPITPRRSDVKIDLVALAWVPQWEFEYRLDSGRERSVLVSAGWAQSKV